MEPSVIPAYALITEPGEPSLHHHGVVINRRWFLSVHTNCTLTTSTFRVFAQELQDDRIHRAFFAYSWLCSSLHRDLVELGEAADGQIFNDHAVNFDELSSFFILSLDTRCDNLKDIRRALETVEDLCAFPAVGCPLLTAHTPFVDSRLLSLVTEAVVSRTFRFDSSVFLTDCRTGRFSQGASLFRNDRHDERMKLIVGLVLYPVSLDISCDSGYHFAVTFRNVVISGALSIEAPSRALHAHIHDFGAARNANFSDAVNRIVMVYRGFKYGSGVVVGKNHVLTCAHILSDERSDISIKVGGAVFTDVEMIVCLTVPDIALLRVQGAEGVMEPVQPLESTPRIGDETAAFGYPFPFFSHIHAPTLTTGIVSAISSQFVPDCQAVFTSCSIVDGFSGGGLFTRDGFWFGLICRSTKTLVPPVNMALCVNTILYYLRDSGVSSIPIAYDVRRTDSNDSVKSKL